VRRLLSAVTVAVLSGGFLAVPVVTLPAVHPHAVSTSLAEVPVRAAATAPGVLGTAARPDGQNFDLVGATWQAGTFDPATTRIQVRVHQGGGWKAWQDLEPTDAGADAGSADARRAARVDTGVRTAEPVWVGRSDGVEARVVDAPGRAAAGGSLPHDLKVVLVDGGDSAADATRRPGVLFRDASAEAAIGRPEIFTRSDWGADESLRRSVCPEGPEYSSTIRMGFVHHTDGINGYTRSQVPSILRGIYAYHVKANGWCDVGYNFLVDRFGRIWEGRYGGITKAVLGAHTGGFNTDSFGTSLIGTFSSTSPSSAMLAAVERLFAWKLSRTYRDPLGTSQLVAGSFSGSRFRAGSVVTFDTVSGHRDADYTTCPGGSAYSKLPDVRAGIRAAMGAGFVTPGKSAGSLRMAGGVLKVRAAVIGKQSWTLTVTDASGATVRTLSGTASRKTKAVASWDLTDAAGVPVLPGTYRLTLSGGTADGVSAFPWSSTFTVTPPVTLDVPAQRALGSNLTAKGTGIPGHEVAVSVSGPFGTQDLGTVPVSDAGTWSAPAPVSLTGDLTWTATDPAAPTYTATRLTRVGPALSEPSHAVTFVAAGTAVAVRGTALPGDGSPVHLQVQPSGAADPTTGSALSVGSDGRWSTSLTPTSPTTLWATDARGLRTGKRLVYPVTAPTASSPDHGYAGRSVRVTGNAGGAPVAVTLSARQPGGVWTDLATKTAGDAGKFAFRLPLADAAGEVTRWRVTTEYGVDGGGVSIEPVFPPTVTGPSRSAWNGVHLLSGRAVPGDRVTIQTAPPGRDWVTIGKVTAAADATWSFPVVFTRDLRWRVSSPSGLSAAGLTRIVPTIRARHTIDRGDRVRLRGRAIPGHVVKLFRRTAGRDTWVEVASTRGASDGTWSVVRRPRKTADWRVLSHRQTSRTIRVTVG
jgi:hypothetical protein